MEPIRPPGLPFKRLIDGFLGGTSGGPLVSKRSAKEKIVIQYYKLLSAPRHKKYGDNLTVFTIQQKGFMTTRSAIKTDSFHKNPKAINKNDKKQKRQGGPVTGALGST